MESITPTDSLRRPSPTPRRIAGFTHLGDVIDGPLDDFERAIEKEIEERGGFRGVVRVEQQRLAQTLDALVAGRDFDRLDSQEAAENKRAAKRASELREEERRADWARRLWSESRPAEGTAVARYLAASGYRGPVPPSLRYLPRHLHSASKRYFPVMLAGVSVWPADAIVAVHRTYLDTEKPEKAPVEPVKMAVGRLSGGAVRLAPHEEELAVVEGIETGLAVQQASGIPTWCTLGTSGLEGLSLPPPDELGRIAIFADGDPPGRKAAGTAAEKWYAAGHCVRIIHAPHGSDFNDVAKTRSE